MIKTSTPRRAISCALAFVLAATLIPSAALPQAYAEPADQAAGSQPADEASSAKAAITSADITSEEVALEAPSGAAAATDSPADAAQPADRAQDGQPADNGGTVDMTRASVNLDQADAAAVVSQAGLTFQLDEAAGTAAVTGVDPSTQIAQLSIPQSIVSGGKEYETTAMICGGGVRASLLILTLTR